MFAFSLVALVPLLPAIAALSIGKRDSIDIPAGTIYPDPAGVQRLRWASRMDLCVTAIESSGAVQAGSTVAIAYCLAPDDANLYTQNFTTPSRDYNTGMTIRVNNDLLYVGSGQSTDNGAPIQLVDEAKGVDNDLWNFTNGSFIEMVSSGSGYPSTGKCLDVEKADSQGDGGQMAALQLWDCTPNTDVQQYFAIYGGSA